LGGAADNSKHESFKVPNLNLSPGLGH
jgi:hypothetical protein